MRRQTKWRVLACLIALKAPVAFAAEDMAATRVELKAFSILPPFGADWRSQIGAGRLEAGRSLDGIPQHTIILIAEEYPLAPEPVASVAVLLDAFRAAAANEPRMAGRYELVSHSETTTDRLGMACVEYEKRWNDHGGHATQGQHLIMASHGLVCVHPRSARRVIEVSYSHRSATGMVPPEAVREGKRFLESLKPRPLQNQDQDKKSN